MMQRRSNQVSSLVLSLLLLLAVTTTGPSAYCAAFVVVRDRQSLATIAATTAARKPSSPSSTTTRLFSDGNPPPFGDWGAAPVAPAPAPAPMSYGAPPEAPPVPASAYNAAPPAPAPAPPAAATTGGGGGGGGGGDPIATLQASQDAAVQQIQARIPDLIFKEDLSWTAADNTLGGSSLTAYDAPGASNVAWLASVCIPQQLSSLTIFNGPLTDVPHVLSRCCVVDANLQLAVDVRPRAYGAYELRDPATGAYPGPEELGRKAFEYSGARNDFFGKFATDSLQAAMDPNQFEGATPLPLSELDQQTGSPLALHLQMPATPDNVAKVVALRQAVAEAWLNWATEGTHEHRPGAPVNTQYVYDSKFRQNCYSALLPYYQQILGSADGAMLAAAESGPLDEGYVGGGS